MARSARSSNFFPTVPTLSRLAFSLALLAVVLAGCGPAEARTATGSSAIPRPAWPAAWGKGVCIALARTEAATVAVAVASGQLAWREQPVARRSLTDAIAATELARADLKAVPKWSRGDLVLRHLTTAGERITDAVTMVRRQLATPTGRFMPAAQKDLVSAGDSLSRAFQSGLDVGLNCSTPADRATPKL